MLCSHLARWLHVIKWLMACMKCIVDVRASADRFADGRSFLRKISRNQTQRTCKWGMIEAHIVSMQASSCHLPGRFSVNVTSSVKLSLRKHFTSNIKHIDYFLSFMWNWKWRFMWKETYKQPTQMLSIFIYSHFIMKFRIYSKQMINRSVNELFASMISTKYPMPFKCCLQTSFYGHRNSAWICRRCYSARHTAHRSLFSINSNWTATPYAKIPDDVTQLLNCFQHIES